ncbi:hypothetical protein CC80DRAFT_430540 [Byssothecium circinans]|uniref:Rhodopsin domain-containing protein n=1 Tax=Byssothecium circinans TaxID=147558 RepID=A0A6A5TIQ8_9PLEO|nr:hypothetical protein CC80DRAFT_430540 [Byssothecium circinans]
MPMPGPDQDRGPRLVATYVVGCAAALIFVALRFWSRISIHAIGADDWCMFVTALIYIPLTVLTSILSLNGGTRHLFYLSQDLEKTIYLTKLNWLAQAFGIFCLSLGKIAIALLIVRLLDRTSRWRKWSLYVASILTGINGLCMLVVNFAQCKDINAIWNPVLRATTECWNPTVQSNFAIYAASFNTAMDFLLAILPITLVWNLRLNVQRKIALCLFLGCGVITGIISALKTSHLRSLSERSDITWETYTLYIWTGVEITLIIVLGSLPPLRALYNNLTGQGNGTKRSGSHARSYGQRDVSGTGRSKPSYKPMDSEISHPLVSVSVPEKSHGGVTQQTLGKGEVHITRTFETVWNAPSTVPSRSSS